MNAQERLRLERLMMRIAQQPDRPKDKDAERELAALLKVRPDAPYLLMELALVLEMSLEQAQAELDQSRQTRHLPQRGSHFQHQPMPAYQAMPSYSMRSRMMSPFSGGGSFLRNAAAMAAGVVGGSLLFQGLDNMFGNDEHHHHHYGDDAGALGMQDTGFSGGGGFEGGGFGMDESDWV